MNPASISHHLDDATLLAYAAGTLPEAFDLMVATHLSLCDVCRAAAGAFDVLGAAVALDDAPCAQMDAGSLQSVIAHLPDMQARPLRAKPAGIIPAPLQDYIGGNLDAVRWRPIGMGVKQAILKTSGTATARLLSIPAGAAMPDHGHHGTEMTMVLDGAFRDEDARFARGDVEIADSDVHHTPIADIGADCICLAVTDAPLQFDGVLARIWQKIIRI